MRKYLLSLVTFGIGLLPVNAGFTPPTDVTPYLPQNNVVKVTAVTVVGSYTLYSYTGAGNGFVLVLSTSPAANAPVAASANVSWLAFRAATLTPDALSNPTVVNQAENWWQVNVYNPYYPPLLVHPTPAAVTPAVPVKVNRAELDTLIEEQVTLLELRYRSKR